MTTSSSSSSAVKLARAQVVGKVMESLLDQVDFGRIGADHAPDLENLCRTLMGEAVTPAVERQLGGPQGLGDAARELADDLVQTRGFLSLLQHSRISDILVNGMSQVYIEQDGQLQVTGVVFPSVEALERAALWMTARVGRPVTHDRPMVDARLPDGSRLNAIIPPLALDGPSLTIRRFGSNPLTLEDLLKFGTFTPEMVMFLEGAMKARLNIIISGGTGSGKTTLLNTLSSFISNENRIVTIEDAAEIQLQQEHVLRLETRPANIEGKGEVNATDLVKNALRMRPDRIIIGECRGGETLDMLQAMNTGHDGSLTTVHANSPRDAISRIETLVSMSGIEIPLTALRKQISSAIHLIVQASRLQGGPRKVTYITEVVGMEQDILVMQDIFKFVQDGIDGSGKAVGHFVSTGVRPKCIDVLEASGVKLPPSIFAERVLRG